LTPDSTGQNQCDALLVVSLSPWLKLGMTATQPLVGGNAGNCGLVEETRYGRVRYPNFMAELAEQRIR
jgi:hypothetical protein